MTEVIGISLPKEVLDKMGIKPGQSFKAKKIVPMEYVFEVVEE